MPAADGKAKSFILLIGIPLRGIIGGILKGKNDFDVKSNLGTLFLFFFFFLAAADGKAKSFIYLEFL